MLAKRVIILIRRKNPDIAVDSTGFRTHSSSLWYDIRIRRKNKRKDCLKLHLCIDVELGLVLEFNITPGNRHDSRDFKKLLESLEGIGKTAGDKAYSSRKNCELVLSKQGKPYLYFKSNARGLAKGSSAWKQAYHEFKANPEKWLAEFHIRSLIEAVNSSIKRRFGSFLLSRHLELQAKELGLKVLAYQLKQVILHQQAKDQDCPYWIEVR
jgi:transposase